MRLKEFSNLLKAKYPDAECYRNHEFGGAPVKNGLAIVFKPDGKAYSEIAKYKVAEKAIYAHPVISDNHIFVRDEDSVAMWTIE